MRVHLVTIPFSHFCEKARWALDRARIPFSEEAHLPLLHTRATRPLGGRSTPLLVVTDGDARRVIADSTDILRFVDEVRTTGAPLFPPGDEHTVALEARFDDVLGPHARRIGYFELFKSNATLASLVARSSVSALQKVVGVPSLPIFKALLRRALKVDAAGAARSEARVREVFGEVEALLRDGRRFLTGDTFTAADLTFASLAAPLVMPPAYQKYVLPLDRVPASFRATVEAWRATAPGAYALKLYETERLA